MLLIKGLLGAFFQIALFAVLLFLPAGTWNWPRAILFLVVYGLLLLVSTAMLARLAPASLDVQIEGRLVKLDRRLMEYLMLCIAMVLFYQRLGENWASGRRLLSAVDFADVLDHFPESVVPGRRKKRSYISSILSKNELSRKGPYNRKLCLPVRPGQYLVNGLKERTHDFISRPLSAG